jgi:hypothetical protein
VLGDQLVCEQEGMNWHIPSWRDSLILDPLPEQQAATVWMSGGPYSHLKDPLGVGVGKNFTSAQKRNIIKANKERNGGVVRSDLSGEELILPQKSQRGVTPPDNEWQIDHIIPKDQGGTNSYSNAQVLSRKENRAKWNK